ncbi:hypothetical protein DLM_3615 [Aquitalea magnusonii]|uniref:Uncharacterized protein n=1 Tax=Aquitalea magnusonii TaxID=332411 RepID=A0A3G9GMK7_9NEIS|nr:hypothetical protein DLM_3615 [Aquitalea magnusonii]
MTHRNILGGGVAGIVAEGITAAAPAWARVPRQKKNPPRRRVAHRHTKDRGVQVCCQTLTDTQQEACHRLGGVCGKAVCMEDSVPEARPVTVRLASCLCSGAVPA